MHTYTHTKIKNIQSSTRAIHTDTIHTMNEINTLQYNMYIHTHIPIYTYTHITQYVYTHNTHIHMHTYTHTNITHNT